MSLPEGFSLRLASTADLDILVAHRRNMFRDMGYEDEVVMDSMSQKFRRWLLNHMNAGDYYAWLVTAPDGTIAAGAAIWVMDWPAHMIGSGQRGNILNVYTAEAYRRRGLARELMASILDWCRETGIDTVVLHASPSGKQLYESMGFEPTSEMRRRL